MKAISTLLVIAAVLLVTAFVAIETTCIIGRVRRAGWQISPWTGFGLLALGPREVVSLALIAAAIAVSAPVYQREIGSPLPIGFALVAIAQLVGVDRLREQRALEELSGGDVVQHHSALHLVEQRLAHVVLLAGR